MNFLLIAQPQTEMHVLADIFRSHPDISLPVIGHDKRLETLFAAKKLQGRIIKSYLMQISFKTYLRKRSSNKLIGIFANLDLALSCNLLTIFKHINKDVRVILLKRRNTLEQYASLLMKQKKEIQSIYCNEEEFFAFYKKLELFDIDIKIELDRLSIPYTEIYYEDLSHDISNELNGLKEYLGLKHSFNASTEYFKLEKKPLNQIINNYTSFYDTFKDTRFKVFF